MKKFIEAIRTYELIVDRPDKSHWVLMWMPDKNEYMITYTEFLFKNSFGGETIMRYEQIRKSTSKPK